MERHSAKLADLKLVSKYYPVGNYSYPRPEAPLHRHDIIEGRSSLGSDCSEPGMIEDHESDVSAEEYHTIGAELWDSFWQASGGDHEGRKSQYPALIPSPGSRKALEYFEETPRIAGEDDHEPRSRAQSRVSDDMPSWPLPPTPVSASLPKPEADLAAQSGKQQKFITPKASYSLFPVPPSNNSQRQPLPRRVSHEEVRRSYHQHSPSEVAEPASAKYLKPGHITLPSGNIPAGLSSAPVTPSYPMTSPAINTRPTTANPQLTRAAPSDWAQPSQHTHQTTQSMASLRTRAASMSASSSSYSSAALQPVGTNSGSLSPSYPPPPPPLPCSSPGFYPTHSAAKSLDAGSSSCTSRSNHRRPSGKGSMLLPPPVSVFEFDSDDDSGGGGGKLARRLKRGLHRPSASEGHHHHSHHHSKTVSGAAACEREQLRRAPVLKKQRSEVFSRMLGRKSH